MLSNNRADLVRNSPRTVRHAIKTSHESVARGLVHQHIGSTSLGEVAFEATKVVGGAAQSVDENEQLRRTVSTL